MEDAQDIRALAKAYRANRSRARKLRGTRMSGHYMNAGLEAIARNRNDAASHVVTAELLELRAKIHAFPRGDELTRALDAEDSARQSIRSYTITREVLLNATRAVNALVKEIGDAEGHH